MHGITLKLSIDLILFIKIKLKGAGSPDHFISLCF